MKPELKEKAMVYRNNLKAIRKKKGMSQIELAASVGIAQPLLCQIEVGRRGLSLALAVELASALGVSVMAFTKNIPEKSPEK